MTIYTGVADENGEFTIPFSSNYTGGQKITVTAEKSGAEKTVELYAPSEPVSQNYTGMTFDGDLTIGTYPGNIGNATIQGVVGAIGAMAFYANQTPALKAITGLTIKDGVTSILASAFQYWNGALYLILPNTLESIEMSAFEGWINSKSLTIPDSVITMSVSSFMGWNKSLELKLSQNCNVIPANCFRSWSELRKLSLHSSVTSIGDSAFMGMLRCTEIISLAATPPSILSTTFQGLNASCIFKVPASSVAAYKAAANWSAFASRIQAI